MTRTSDSPEAQRRRSVAEEVMESASYLSSRAEGLVDRLTSLLGPVTTQPVPRPVVPGISKAIGASDREYPPLFSDLRHHFERIETSLDAITDVLDRTEL